MGTTEYVAIGGITAAVITGFFSFLNMISSKENKVSEFRQSWIDGIRIEISEYVAAIEELARLSSVYASADENEEYFNASLPAYKAESQALTKIRLRINPDHVEKNPSGHEACLMNAIIKVNSHFNDGDYQKALEATTDIRKAAAPFLKNEWERVKNGEKRYQSIRDFTINVLILAIAVMIGSIPFALYGLFTH